MAALPPRPTDVPRKPPKDYPKSARTGRPVRVQMDTRVSPIARDRIEHRAEVASGDHGESIVRADMTRWMLAFADEYMPRRWRPRADSGDR